MLRAGMSAHVFVVTDKTGRRVRLTRERWRHIAPQHPDVTDIEELQRALVTPLLMRSSEHDANVKWYYRYDKERKRFLMVGTRYLNGEGFVITAYYVRKAL